MGFVSTSKEQWIKIIKVSSIFEKYRISLINQIKCWLYVYHILVSSLFIENGI